MSLRQMRKPVTRMSLPGDDVCRWSVTKTDVSGLEPVDQMRYDNRMRVVVESCRSRHVAVSMRSAMMKAVDTAGRRRSYARHLAVAYMRRCCHCHLHDSDMPSTVGCSASVEGDRQSLRLVVRNKGRSFHILKVQVPEAWWW